MRFPRVPSGRLRLVKGALILLQAIVGDEGEPGPLGALRPGLPFRDWNLPTPIATVRERLMKTAQGDRAFVQVL